MEGKNILITGGTTGIGRATALLLAPLGARVMIVGRHKKELDEAMHDLKALDNAEVRGLIADLSEKEDVLRMFKAFDTHFESLDVLINNVGIGSESIVKHSPEELEYTLSTNIGSYLACAREAAIRMKANNGGHIINIGSMSAVTRDGGSSVYVATKAAIQGFSASLRKELSKDQIKVTLIEPGSTATDMKKEDAQKLAKKVKAKEMLDASDIAAGVAYCLSQPARCNIDTLQVTPILRPD